METSSLKVYSLMTLDQTNFYSWWLQNYFLLHHFPLIIVNQQFLFSYINLFSLTFQVHPTTFHRPNPGMPGPGMNQGPWFLLVENGIKRSGSLVVVRYILFRTFVHNTLSFQALCAKGVNKHVLNNCQQKTQIFLIPFFHIKRTGSHWFIPGLSGLGQEK